MYNKDLPCGQQADFWDGVHCSVNALSSPLWDALIWILLGVGLFFTLATGFVQIRLFGQSIAEMKGSRRNPKQAGSITAFQAFVTGLASRVGTGNIAGVAIAITAGGPGAVFWMWLTALIGMSSAFAESSLAQLFKVRDGAGGFRGGPAYYITQGLGKKWLGMLFAVSLISCFGFVFNAIQANTIVSSLQAAAGFTGEAAQAQWRDYALMLGAVLVILSAPVIFGGIKRISRVAELVVPLMAGLYLLLALFVIATNLNLLPQMFGMIFADAFSGKAAAGGLLGAMISQAMMLGIKRGLFSNEAGMGSAPNAAAAADVQHPVSQGMIQMLGVFVDTMIVCSCTAFIILLSDMSATAGLSGVQLTQAALTQHVGTWAQYFLAAVLFLFCFSSILGNYAYAESNMQFIRDNTTVMTVFRMLVLGFVYFGAVSESALVWDMGDLTMGIMALINLIAIALLHKLVLLLLKDYTVKRKLGKEPVFKLAEHPVLKRKIKTDIW